MNPYDLAQRLIDRFGKLLGLEALTLEGGTHSCALEFDGHLSVTFEFHEPSGQMVLSSLLTTLPDPAEKSTARETVLRMLMELNFVDYLGAGSFFSMEPQSRSVALMQSRSVTELDDDTFEHLVEAFVNKAELWKRQIEQVLAGTPPEPLVATAPRTSDAALGQPVQTARPPDGAHIYG